MLNIQLNISAQSEAVVQILNEKKPRLNQISIKAFEIIGPFDNKTSNRQKQ